MTDALFNSESLSSLSSYWWTGIIVSDETWKGNYINKKWNSVDEIPGWGGRYRVRIVGRHTNARNKLKDNDLELCEVLYPVTGGSGHSASYQTSNLRQGSVVFGIYKDGIDGNEPLIIGCIGNNEQTVLNKKQKDGFDPLSGFTRDISVPYYAIPPGGSPPVPGSGQGGKGVAIESNTPSTPLANNIADQNEKDDANVKSNIPQTTTCQPIQLSGISLQIKNLIQDIEKAKKSINDWKYSVSNKLNDIENFISSKIENAAKEIAKWFKGLIFQIKKKITENIERGAKDLYYTLMPNERPKAKKAMETVMDLLNCLFRKILDNLIKMLVKMLFSIVDRFINVPLCAIENIVGALIGKLTGLINSAVQAIMAPLNAILGVVDLVGDILSLVIDILNFLSCDDRPECSQIKEWSIYDGPTSGLTFDYNSVINKVKSFASSVTQSIDPNNFNFDLDFSDIFQDTCNVGPVFCGPPVVEFFGGGGSGSSGNAIISAAGSILGVDILSSGSGYTSAPIVRFVDACGKGTGAVGRAVIGTVNIIGGPGGGPGGPGGTGIGTTSLITNIPGPGGTGIGTTSTGVVSVIIDDPGANYLPSPDGDRGGDERIWATKDETTVKRDDGTYDRPYVPGETINLFPGDIVRLPNNTTTELEFTSDPGTGTGTGTGTGGVEIIPGGKDYTIKNQGTITAPTQDASTLIRGNYPTLNQGQYPVILYLCGLEIDNVGFNYSEGDQIIIEPSNGASAVATFGNFGTLESVKIISGGEGFTEVPDIYIESETGYNAKLTPRFCIDRVSEDRIKEPGVQDKIISIIDCVGKVPQVDFFRVPQ
jgi:hypothetical protein